MEGNHQEAEAIQIITNENHTFKPQLENLVNILGAEDIKDRSVVVVSIAGSLRKGKSFLLNFFLKYLNAQYKKHDVSDWIGENADDNTLDGFKWRGGQHPETVGIWMWSEIFTHDYDNGEKVAIILLDTQGIFDNESSMRDCIAIFGISLLLSSVQCFNVMRNFQEDDLQHLQLFMEYARLIKETADGTPFQELLFIVRDWPNPYENPYGFSEEYVASVLAVKDKQTTEMRELRQQIKKNFSKVKSFLMPYPGKAVAQQKDCKRKLQEIFEFLDGVKKLAPKIFSPDNLVRKKINNEYVRACDLIAYLKSYIDVFNSDDLPEPVSVVTATALVHLRSLYERCSEEYTSQMNEAVDNGEAYFDEPDFDRQHGETFDNVMSMFDSTRKLGGEELISEWREKLSMSINLKGRNLKNANEQRRVGTIRKKTALTLSTVCAGIATGIAAIALAGPFGLGIVAAEASVLATSAIAGGSAVGGAGLGASISAFFTKHWKILRKKEKS